ncbi:MAG: hypothetical protein IJ786_03295 [Bacteroidaceae bacterium]|nr:hypothetical protein [Bacteroidaceae bacterium]
MKNKKGMIGYMVGKYTTEGLKKVFFRPTKGGIARSKMGVQGGRLAIQGQKRAI